MLMEFTTEHLTEGRRCVRLHAMIELNADGKLVKTIKEERGLLERLVVISEVDHSLL